MQTVGAEIRVPSAAGGTETVNVSLDYGWNNVSDTK